jgi:hypothetical protein
MRTSGRNLSPASQRRWVLALTSVASLMVGLTGAVAGVCASDGGGYDALR